MQTTEQKDFLRVSTGDGKYTVIQDAKGRVKALRYGAGWRDCVGDGLVITLALDLEAARSALKTAEGAIERASSWAKTLSVSHRHLVPNEVLNRLDEAAAAITETKGKS